jgi:hypothetical protein
MKCTQRTYIYDEPVQNNVMAAVVETVRKYLNNNTSYIRHNISTVPLTLTDFVENLRVWACRQ